MNDDKKTIEEWATDRGLLPAMLPMRAQVGRLAAQSERPNPRHHLFAMAKTHQGWPVGAEVTEEEFDQAVEEAQNLPLA